MYLKRQSRDRSSSKKNRQLSSVQYPLQNAKNVPLLSKSLSAGTKSTLRARSSSVRRNKKTKRRSLSRLSWQRPVPLSTERLKKIKLRLKYLNLMRRKKKKSKNKKRRSKKD